MIVDSKAETCILHEQLVSTVQTMSANQVTQSEFYAQLKEIHTAQNECNKQINECNVKITNLLEKIGSIGINNKKKEVLLLILAFMLGFVSNNLGWLSLIP